MEHESTVKENEIRKFVTKWMGLQNITLSERAQAKKDKLSISSQMWVLASNMLLFMFSLKTSGRQETGIRPINLGTTR